jgi:hypothetical protein
MASGINPNAGRRTRRFMSQRKTFRAHCSAEQLPCWLCGKPIDYELPKDHPDSFNLDHAYAVTQRPELAEDTANFRPSHKACNERRGNREPLIDLGIPSEDW